MYFIRSRRDVIVGGSDVIISPNLSVSDEKNVDFDSHRRDEFDAFRLASGRATQRISARNENGCQGDHVYGCQKKAFLLRRSFLDVSVEGARATDKG